MLHLKMRYLKKYLKLIYLIPALVVMIDIFDNFYILSLLNSLAFQIAIALILFSVLLMTIKRYKFSLISFASALYLLASISVFDKTVYNSFIEDDNISVSHFNVLRTNKNYDTIINSALISNSDIISFQEINTAWADSLILSLSEKYPYHIIEKNDENYFGIALFSKHKILNPKIVYIEDVPNIFATIHKDNYLVDVITAHTNSPISKERFIKRNKHIKALAELAKTDYRPLLVIGDFNAVPWDSRIIKFKRQTALLDSRNALLSTWPRQLGKLGIPLDYIFHSENLTCVNFQVIRQSSSDHCGIKGVYNIDLQTNIAIANN